MKTCLFVFSLIIANQAFALDQGFVFLHSGSPDRETEITLTYQSIDPEGDTRASSSIQVDIHAPLGSVCRLKAHAILKSFCESPSEPIQAEADLAPNDSDSGAGCFYRSVGKATIVRQTHAGDCRQEIDIKLGDQELHFNYAVSPTEFAPKN